MAIDIAVPLTLGPNQLLTMMVVGSVVAPATETTDEQWERVIDTNVNGVFYVAREVGKVMLAQGYGKIINIGSFHCQVTMNGFPRSGYSTAKGAVYMMTKALAAEWAKSGITVNTLGPGYFKSEMADAVTDDRYEATIKNGCPMGRRGTPGELNGAMLFHPPLHIKDVAQNQGRRDESGPPAPPSPAPARRTSPPRRTRKMWSKKISCHSGGVLIG